MDNFENDNHDPNDHGLMNMVLSLLGFENSLSRGIQLLLGL